MRARYYAGIAGLAALMSAGIVPLAAQTGPVPRPLAPELTPEARRQLLETRQRLAEAVAKAGLKPNVTCGMVVIPADPKVDPKAVKPVPDQKTNFTIRQVPPAC
jgi:hypothetical protein